MAKFQCVCGHVLTTSGPIPNPTEWLALHANEVEGVLAMSDPVQQYLVMTSIYRCPASDHLWIFWDGFEAEPTLYAPTSPDPAG